MLAIITMPSAEREAMGLRGRSKAAQEFSEERVVRAYLGRLARIGL